MDKLDRKIVNILQNNCRISHTIIGKALNLSKDAVRLRIKKLEKEGVILHYNTVLDLRPLGIEKFHFLCKLNKELSQETIARIEKDPAVSFANTFAGRYNLHIIVDTKSVYELQVIKDRFIRLLEPAELVVMQFVQELRNTMRLPEHEDLKYEKRNDNSFSKIRPQLERARIPFKYTTIDERDSKILKAICKDSRSSLVKIAQEVNCSRETVKQRITKLIDKKIINGFYANVSFTHFGYTTHFLLVKGSSQNIDRVREMKNVFYAAQVEGAYTTIIYILTKTPEELRESIGKIQKIGGKETSFELLLFDKILVYKQFQEEVEKTLNKV